MGRKRKGGDDAGKAAAKRARVNARSRADRAAVTAAVRASAVRAVNALMPGARVREDGWTAARTKVFLGKLSETGCISDAARLAGISRNSVRRARGLYAPFDKACRAALAQALRGLEAVAYQRAVEGRETIIIRKGEEVERRISPSDAMLKLLIQRGDISDVGAGLEGGAALLDERGLPLGPDDVISRAEHAAGWEWIDGQKSQAAAGARDRLMAKLDDMAARIGVEERADARCRRCHQPLNDAVWAEILRRGGGRDPYAVGDGAEI